MPHKKRPYSSSGGGDGDDGGSSFSSSSSLPPVARKQFVIKLVKDKLALPTNFKEDTWMLLKCAITSILLKRPDPYDFEKLYQAVMNLCICKMGGKLYQCIEQECELHVSAAISSLVGQSPDVVVFLSLVEKCWRDFCDQMLMIRSIALYLDKTYVKQNPRVPSLWDMGLKLFHRHFFSSQEVEHKTVAGILRLVSRERLGESIDRILLNHLLKMFIALGIYTENFEKPFFESTSEFYASESAEYMRKSDVPGYLKHVELRLNEEHERCLLYLDESTRKPLLKNSETQLVERHTFVIVEKGFILLMDAHRIEDLQRMYTLFQRVNALELLRQAVYSYIRATGQVFMMDEEKGKDLVSYLLEFKDSLDAIWKESFFRNDAFYITIKDAFQHLINLHQNRAAEFIAKFVDDKLRAGKKGVSEEELEGTLDRVMVFFRFVQGKDVFEAFYKKDLAKRLLLGKSVSIDAEKSMISKFKAKCGSQFTNKLEGMFMVNENF